MTLASGNAVTLTLASNQTATFASSVTGVTEATADNSTKLASTAFVKNQGYLTSSQNYYIGTTLNALNRTSASQTLTGVSIDGNAATTTLYNSYVGFGSASNLLTGSSNLQFYDATARLIVGSTVQAVKVELAEVSAVGTSPTAGYGRFWTKTDGTPHYVNSAGTDIQLGAAGSGGVTTMAAIGAVPNANAASISGSILTLQPASASFGGLVTTGTQSFAGAKTFTADITGQANVRGLTGAFGTYDGGVDYPVQTGYGVSVGDQGVISYRYSISLLNTAPASATATGVVGEIRWTAGYVYLCTATNTWVRAALATW